MSAWLPAAQRLGRQGIAFVVVTIAATKGSIPREAGTKMLVAQRETIGTIGGGHLEYQAINMARVLLTGSPSVLSRRFALGPSLGQCCGGVVDLLFEYDPPDRLEWIDVVARELQSGTAVVAATIVDGEHHERLIATSKGLWQEGAVGEALHSAATDLAWRMHTMSGARPSFNGSSPRADGVPGQLMLVERIEPFDLDIVLFGAGHVGRALASILGTLPCRVTWVDSRDGEFGAMRPDNVVLECTDTPEFEVDAAAPGACFLVMTHSHALDFALTTRILARGDFRYFGLIGSVTKRRRFERRLRDRGTSVDALSRITCPIGIGGVSGKEPCVIAVAVAAELLKLRGVCSTCDASSIVERQHQRQTLPIFTGARSSFDERVTEAVH